MTLPPRNYKAADRTGQLQLLGSSANSTTAQQQGCLEICFPPAKISVITKRDLKTAKLGSETIGAS
jgi:hypothetical protein